MRVLVVDEQMVPRRMAAKMIRDCGVADVLEAESADNALALLEAAAQSVDLVLTDLRLPVMDGRALLREVRIRWPEKPVVVLTAFATVRDAVELVKEGAFDYIAKPFEMEDVATTIRRALRLADVVRDNERLRRELEGRYSFETLIGNSPLLKAIRPDRFVTDTVGLPTITDILKELEKPGRDPRPAHAVIKRRRAIQQHQRRAIHRAAYDVPHRAAQRR